MKKISVIVLTYKPDYYIWECLNSIATQSLDKEKYEVLIILNGVDLEKYDSLVDEESPIKLSENKFNILYTGAHGTANCLEFILEVAKLLKDDNIMFNLIGEGEKKKSL